MADTALLALAGTVLALVCVLGPREREAFGGPVKVLRRIPKTECRVLCDNWFFACLRGTRQTDSGRCESQRAACYSACRYSEFQRA